MSAVRDHSYVIRISVPLLRMPLSVFWRSTWVLLLRSRVVIWLSYPGYLITKVFEEGRIFVVIHGLTYYVHSYTYGVAVDLLAQYRPLDTIRLGALVIGR